ncbi:MAG: UpxY family transcription antiterminator [Bacteroidia bacterium]|nr:UpxY family transcription antiterminator [Bacteroidia bacterium]
MKFCRHPADSAIEQMTTMLNDTQHKKWYVLQTRPRVEKQVGGRLTEKHFENFVPLQRQLRQWHDRKKWVEMPLFSSYIFVRTEDKFRSKVFEVGGLLKYVSIGGQICVLTEQEIERVKRLCSYSGQVNIEQGLLKAGDEIEIIDGHFAGLHGQLTTTPTNHKIKISIASLNCFATVELDKNNVKKIIF